MPWLASGGISRSITNRCNHSAPASAVALGLAREKRRDPFVAQQRLARRLAPAQRVDVGPHHVRQQDRADRRRAARRGTCPRWARPGRERPPSPALAKAMPPNRLAIAISKRAASLGPPAKAFSSERATRRIPSMQSESVTGFAREQTNGSMSWASASIPVDAVTAVGDRRSVPGRPRRPWAALTGCGG